MIVAESCPAECGSTEYYYTATPILRNDGRKLFFIFKLNYLSNFHYFLN